MVGLLAAVLTQTSMPAAARAADPPAAVAAAELARQLGGTPANFVLVHEAPAVAGGGWAGKLVDARSGEVHAVHVATGGAVVVGAEALAPAAAAPAPAAAANGKADRALTVAMAGAAATKELPVAIWLDVDTEPAESAVRGRHPEVSWVAGRPMAGSLAQARTLRGELWEARRGAYAAAADAIRPAIEAAGGSIAYVSTSAPVVFVDVPSSGIAPLSGRAEVLSLGLEGGWETEMSSAGPTVRANWTTGGGDQGTGVRVGIVEYHNVRNTGDLAGQVVKSYSTTGRLAYGSGSDDHPTWVGGAVASRSGGYPGTAPGADLVSASTGGYRPSLATDRAIIQAADWAVAPSGGDADVVNASIGQDTATGAEEARRYFDSIGWEDGRLVVSASGNFTTFGNWDVVSPATGYNVLAVGGINDRNTAGWGDDRVWYVPGSNGSSYRDRTDASWNTHGDFNKPNLSAPSVSVRTANGMIGDGTSVASPMVAGIAAQLIARAPSLATWPEGTRAILLAGARRHTPMSDGSANVDHEGVGTADATWSNRILSGSSFGSYRIGSMAAGSVPSQQFRVIKGQRVRVALAWSSHTSGSSNTGKSDSLTSDLDLRVIGPDGAVRWGATFDNAYETVDITAGRTGTMRIEIRSSRFGASEEPYGLAWTIGGPFTDADDSAFRGDILWALEEGVTAGCSATKYCPSSTVTREQMASFLVRALNLPPASRDFFTDDETSQHEGQINALAAAGITGGCSATRYCPRSVVTREQMASFLVRALHLRASSRDFFTDDSSSQHQASINALAAAGITGGCSATRYCPRSSVTRGQMAAFLHRAFD
jgi:hypothetical protein